MKKPTHESLVRAGWIPDSGNPADMVEVTTVLAGYTSTVRATKLQHEYAAEAVRQRQAKGLYTVCEVAQEFENYSFIPDAKSFLHTRLIPAITSGALRAISESDGLPLSDCTKVNPMGDHLTPADVNEWLEINGACYRWKVERLNNAEPDYQKTPEYQAEYAKAWESLDAVDDIEKAIKVWEAASAPTVSELKDKERTIAALKSKRDALMASVFPRDTQQPAQEQTPATPVVATACDGLPIPKSKRPDLLTPLIEKAQRDESDPFSAAVIWPKLCDMAERKTTPFMGKTESGLKWIDANDSPKFLTKEALGDRLRRVKRAR